MAFTEMSTSVTPPKVLVHNNNQGNVAARDSQCVNNFHSTHNDSKHYYFLIPPNQLPSAKECICLFAVGASIYTVTSYVQNRLKEKQAREQLPEQQIIKSRFQIAGEWVTWGAKHAGLLCVHAVTHPTENLAAGITAIGIGSFFLCTGQK